MNKSISCLLALVLVGTTALAQEAEKRPNVLLIGVDDLNDWIGCLGRHPQAKTPHRNNTYIVLFSDHGFHQGEKERYAKRSIWKDGAGVPLIMAGPGIVRGKKCDKPVQLLDIYPTLLALTGLKADPLHEGHSLVPLLKDPEAKWAHLARSSFGPGNYAIISKRYRFIQYNDGSEELYDHANDPHEWHNVVNDPKYARIVKRHRRQVPQKRYEILGKGSTGHLSYAASEENRRSDQAK